MASLAPTRTRGQSGFTLIETMVAAVLMIVGLAATLTIVQQAGSTTRKTRSREQATNLQRELVEAARSVPYDQLNPNGVGAAIRARPALGDSSLSGAGWTIERRGTPYTVSVGLCTVDDPRDGRADHQSGVFCGATPTQGQCASSLSASVLGTVAPVVAAVGAGVGACGLSLDVDGRVNGLVEASASACVATTTPPVLCNDTNPADYKRVVSVVRWPGGYNLQTTQINNPGLSAAPAVTSLTPAATTITDTRTSLAAASTTTNGPATVALYLDGSQIGTGTATSADAWNATWNLGAVTTTAGAQPAAAELVDGSYELSEKAFDEYGQYGATRSQTVVVNRRVPFASAHVEVGRTAGGVEIDWSPAKEHDSEGFRVDRQLNGGAWSTVCPIAAQTSCLDQSAPAAASGQTLSYSVVGYDRDAAGALRAGDRSEVAPVNDVSPPARPYPPPTLTATASGTNVVLTWTAPAVDGLHPTPDHYLIYRDGHSFADRLDSAYFSAGQPLSYTDTHTTGQAHDYWITAVNSNLGESTPVGPVRR